MNELMLLCTGDMRSEHSPNRWLFRNRRICVYEIQILAWYPQSCATCLRL